VNFKVGDKVRIKDGSAFTRSDYGKQGLDSKGQKLLGTITGIHFIRGFEYSVRWSYGDHESNLDYGYNDEDLELDELYATKLAKLL
jgi:hypothetical protein